MDQEEAMIQHIIRQTICIMFIMMWYYSRHVRPRFVQTRKRSYGMIEKIPEQVRFMKRVTQLHESDCFDILRMSKDAFSRFCFLLEHRGGLTERKYVGIPEKVSPFLAILSHHAKNRVVKFAFMRSGHTVSIYFHAVLEAVLRLHSVLLAKPEPVDNNCDDPVWKPFKGCLGAMDGTYIRVEVNRSDAPRYRNRKGTISINVLGVCDRQMRFVYVLARWEGSAADARILRDAINKPDGLKIPQGNYYLVDSGYANAPGSLAPFRSIRYHLQEWTNSGLSPQNQKEYFNMKHASARNIIERTFGLLKKRWAVLRSPSFYSIDTQNSITLACALIHNFCRNSMSKDPIEDESSSENEDDEEDEEQVPPTEFIDGVNSSLAWNTWRDELAHSMYNEWRATRNRRRM